MSDQDRAVESMHANLAAKTGKTLEQWVALHARRRSTNMPRSWRG
jgi:uncharacterized protein YktB (UPF0637 family)